MVASTYIQEFTFDFMPCLVLHLSFVGKRKGIQASEAKFQEDKEESQVKTQKITIQQSKRNILICSSLKTRLPNITVTLHMLYFNRKIAGA